MEDGEGEGEQAEPSALREGPGLGVGREPTRTSGFPTAPPTASPSGPSHLTSPLKKNSTLLSLSSSSAPPGASSFSCTARTCGNTPGGQAHPKIGEKQA